MRTSFIMTQIVRKKNTRRENFLHSFLHDFSPFSISMIYSQWARKSNIKNWMNQIMKYKARDREFSPWIIYSRWKIKSKDSLIGAIKKQNSSLLHVCRNEFTWNMNNNFWCVSFISKLTLILFHLLSENIPRDLLLF